MFSALIRAPSILMASMWVGDVVQAEIQRLEQEVTKEKRREREAEAAAAAGVGFGLYERHEKKEDEEQTGYGGEKKHHGFFGL